VRGACTFTLRFFDRQNFNRNWDVTYEVDFSQWDAEGVAYQRNTSTSNRRRVYFVERPCLPPGPVAHFPFEPLPPPAAGPVQQLDFGNLMDRMEEVGLSAASEPVFGFWDRQASEVRNCSGLALVRPAEGGEEYKWVRSRFDETCLAQESTKQLELRQVIQFRVPQTSSYRHPGTWDEARSTQSLGTKYREVLNSAATPVPTLHCGLKSGRFAACEQARVPHPERGCSGADGGHSPANAQATSRPNQPTQDRHLVARREARGGREGYCGGHLPAGAEQWWYQPVWLRMLLCQGGCSCSRVSGTNPNRRIWYSRRFSHGI
jgi:hypothetical protein